MSRASRWFYRFTALHFLVTAATSIPLYFRGGGGRPGWYSDEVKEWLVMIHNGEWISYVLMKNPFWSGMIIGAALSVALARSAFRALSSRAPAP